MVIECSFIWSENKIIDVLKYHDQIRREVIVLLVILLTFQALPQSGIGFIRKRI
jgi:hypothetical protein